MGTVNAGMFSSTTDEWPTPQAFFDSLNDEFCFTLDAAASAKNAKCANYYTSEDDGLSQPWQGVVWVNPPYGRVIGRWVAKAWEESQKGAVVVCLIPARTDTAYWHTYVMLAAEVRFVNGRLHFDCPEHRDRQTKAHNAPFPSAVVVFRPGHVGLPKMRSMGRFK